MRVLVACLSLMATVVTAGAASSIDWRVKQPFRYFTDTIDFDMHRRAFADAIRANGGSVSAKPVSDVEARLNSLNWLGSWYRAHSSKYPASTSAGGGTAMRGWAHHVERRRATCWDAADQWHSSCRSDAIWPYARTDYVLPKAHTVIVKLKEPPVGRCRWIAERPVFVEANADLTPERTRPCGEEVEARIPFDPAVTTGTGLRVELPSGEPVATTILVRDRLIVGLGDSYSSGEGNPDTPVEVTRAIPKFYKENYNFTYDGAEKALQRTPSSSFPIRKNGRPAFWTDRKCHRSSYSYHLRTALQVALADPKHGAVTFLGFACSGAEIVEGFLRDYIGVEVVGGDTFSAGGRVRKDMPQVDRLMTELCRDNLTAAPRRRRIAINPPLVVDGPDIASLSMLDCPAGKFLRPIDMMLISIGGNDVGFTPLVKTVLTAKPPQYASGVDTPWFLNAAINALKGFMGSLTVPQAEERAKQLPARFEALREALRTLPIKTGDDGRPNIFLTAFPLIENNESGKLCGTDDPRESMEGVNVAGVLSIHRPTLAAVSNFAANDLHVRLSAAAIAGRWHFVAAHRNPFAKRGVCAQRAGSENTPAESLMLPYWKGNTGPWLDYDPVSATRAYAPRLRLFRTLNDACMFVQFKRSGSPNYYGGTWGIGDLIESCMGGPFHPTAEGHAVIADAVYAEAKKVLGLNDPTIADLVGE